jgi:hypothetical protein
LLREGDELRLLEGHALVTFASGARVALQGPAELTIASELSADLATGALTAQVPRQAMGFVIGTPHAQLVDLGTEFTSIVDGDRSLELHVFAGMVELTLIDDEHRAVGAPLRVSQGVAVKVDGKSRTLRQIDYNASKRVTLP